MLAALVADYLDTGALDNRVFVVEGCRQRLTSDRQDLAEVHARTAPGSRATHLQYDATASGCAWARRYERRQRAVRLSVPMRDRRGMRRRDSLL